MTLLTKPHEPPSRVWGFGFSGLGFRVAGSKSRISGFGFRGLRVESLGFRVSRSGFMGFRASGVSIRLPGSTNATAEWTTVTHVMHISDAHRCQSSKTQYPKPSMTPSPKF